MGGGGLIVHKGENTISKYLELPLPVCLYPCATSASISQLWLITVLDRRLKLKTFHLIQDQNKLFRLQTSFLNIINSMLKKSQYTFVS